MKMTIQQRRELAGVLGALYDATPDGTDLAWEEIAIQTNRRELVSTNRSVRDEARACSRVALDAQGRPSMRIKNGVRLCDKGDFEKMIRAESKKLSGAGLRGRRRVAMFTNRFGPALTESERENWAHTLKKFGKTCEQLIESDLIVARRSRMAEVREAARESARANLFGV